MNSRDSILAKVKAAQPEPGELPPLDALTAGSIREANASRFRQVLESIGGKLFPIHHEDAIPALIAGHFKGMDRIITTLPALQYMALQNWAQEDPHILEHVQLAVIEASMAVAENGAVWVTEEDIVQRAVPFICEHLVVVVRKADIVSNMHQAYERIAYNGYGFGVFIAGPSKTADIEQSLVLGAHGPKTMSILLVEQ